MVFEKQLPGGSETGRQIGWYQGLIVLAIINPAHAGNAGSGMRDDLRIFCLETVENTTRRIRDLGFCCPPVPHFAKPRL
jgi:hypothetical protein